MGMEATSSANSVRKSEKEGRSNANPEINFNFMWKAD